MKLGDTAQIQKRNRKPTNSVTFHSLLSIGHGSIRYVAFSVLMSIFKVCVNQNPLEVSLFFK